MICFILFKKKLVFFCMKKVFFVVFFFASKGSVLPPLPKAVSSVIPGSIPAAITSPKRSDGKREEDESPIKDENFMNYVSSVKPDSIPAPIASPIRASPIRSDGEREEHELPIMDEKFMNYVRGHEVVRFSDYGTDPRMVRMPYMYLDKVLVPLEMSLRRFVLFKIAQDIENSRSSPQLMCNKEYDSSGNRMLKVGKPLANRYETIIMELAEFRSGSLDKSNFLIKYQGNCHFILNGISAIHPLVLEEFFMRTIWRLVEEKQLRSQIIPQVYTVSPPALLSVTRTIKTDFRMSSRSRLMCVSAKAAVRYMIMEKGGRSLERMMAEGFVFSFKKGMEVLKQLFEILDIIHSGGFIHGDIHRGNVVESRTESDKYWLIDFGMARFVERADGGLKLQCCVNPRINTVSTHWTLSGQSPSFRDDAMQALMTVATIVGGEPYLKKLAKAERGNDTRSFISMLRDTNFFADMSSNRDAMKVLGEILRIVRGLPFGEPVPFVDLREQIDKILDALAEDE
jgi:hypothetical protein